MVAEDKVTDSFLFGRRLPQVFWLNDEREESLTTFSRILFAVTEIVPIFAALEPAKPLNDAQMCGSFFYVAMPDKRPYAKSYTSAKDLVALLQSRGLRVDDTVKAQQYLRTISYYRLSAYLYPLLEKPKQANRFKTGSSFGQAMRLYRFDKKLRLFLFNEIEKIEVAVRTAIIDECTLVYNDIFWMTNKDNYIKREAYIRTMSIIDEELRRSHEDFIVHFKEAYSNPYPPAWILAEILPLGVLTGIFVNLNSPIAKKRVAQRFGLQLPVFNSWMTIVTLTRNSCCHHSRVWNKQNTIQPLLPKKICHAWITLPTNTLRIYFNICIVKYFLDCISPNNDMKEKLETLLSAYPEIDPSAMGFPNGWHTERIWQ